MYRECSANTTTPRPLAPENYSLSIIIESVDSISRDSVDTQHMIIQTTHPVA